ncbi:hypothetical protein AK812_SmicGene38125 [Symbiodinium microadriaticum]|uniref:Uncharacterized protein n=1 Tax=Symbiodinium microadriaticum TaxID=2951 RepID=A0A1Q9CEH0_SYMMI|nr:hypothetical protein AK812_SmicGene38125 [Symbiodinium microadriaticum]
MPVSLCLPEHMQVVANEELVLLQKLRSLTPQHRQHPSLTLLTRNEIFKMARELLDGESWGSFCEFAFQLSQSSGHDGIIAFPLPCLHAVDAVTDAEALAESFLQEGSGSLWSAVREVVRCLPFEEDGREVAEGRVFRLGLYCKGGFMGVSKTSWSHVAVGRLLNAAVLTTFRGLRDFCSLGRQPRSWPAAALFPPRLEMAGGSLIWGGRMEAAVAVRDVNTQAAAMNARALCTFLDKLQDLSRPGSSTEACASQPGEMGEIGLGMDMGLSARTIFILDSDEEEDIARAIAASLERSTVDASMNDFSLEEMD